MSRRRSVSVAALSLALAMVLGCDGLGGKKDGAASASPKTSTSAQGPTKTAAQPSSSAAAPGSASTAGEGPKDAKGVDFAKLLGNEGWTFPPFEKLKAGMLPADVAKVMPGGEKHDEFGFADIKVTDVVGVAQYRLSYLDEGGKKVLKFAEIYFDPKFTDDPFFNAIVDHLKKKLGNDFKDHGDKHLNWISSSLQMVSLSKGITHEGYEIQIALTDK
jgi:hypothetical protein